jgi:pimeloyl-ACP methyl ester carboxylesterase
MLLPQSIRSRMVPGINGLAMHVLEAGFEIPHRPCVVLLHGFPELAYSWREVMLPIAEAGYHVIAPDQRGYGRTLGSDDRYDGDLDTFCFPNLVRDVFGLVSAFGYRTVAAVVGHDFGSPVAAYCALLRPDVFRSLVLMSAPFPGPPPIPFATIGRTDPGTAHAAPFADLARLDPPRKHYTAYYCTREANGDMLRCEQGVHAFLRAYFHVKSADWKGNEPFELPSSAASELAKLPRYYVMDLDKGMAETVAAEMPSAREIAACSWLPDDELAVFANEFSRTGFQGGLQWYRCRNPRASAALELYAGMTIGVPATFIAGKSDWGVYQSPGALRAMRTTSCEKMESVHLIEGAGHWVQQEQPEAVSDLIVSFLRRHEP